MAITQARFCLSLLEVEKRRVWKWVSERKEAQDEVCYSASPQGVRTTRRPGESAHCPHMPHTNTRTHTADRKQALPRQKPNMLQHLSKKSENECKLRSFSPPLSHYLTLVIQSPSAVAGAHCTPFSVWGSAQPYAGATRNVSKEQWAGNTFCSTYFYSDTDFSHEVQIKQLVTSFWSSLFAWYILDCRCLAQVHFTVWRTFQSLLSDHQAVLLLPEAYNIQ